MPRSFSDKPKFINALPTLMLALFVSSVVAQVGPPQIAPLHYFDESTSDWNSYFTVADTGTDARILVWVAGDSLQEKMASSANILPLDDPALLVERLNCTDPTNALTCDIVESYENDDWATSSTESPPNIGRLQNTNISEVYSELFSDELFQRDSALLLNLPAGLYRTRVAPSVASESSQGLVELNIHEFKSGAIYAPSVVGANIFGMVMPDGTAESGVLELISQESIGWRYRFVNHDIDISNALAALNYASPISHFHPFRSVFISDSGDAPELYRFTVEKAAAGSQILIWAVGPSISSNVDGMIGIGDPSLSLFACEEIDGACDTLIAVNDNFGDAPTISDLSFQDRIFLNESLEQALASVFDENGGLATNESALLTSLPAGHYAVAVTNQSTPFSPGLTYIGLVQLGANAIFDASNSTINIFNLDIGDEQPITVELTSTGVLDEFLLTKAQLQVEIDRRMPSPVVVDSFGGLNADEGDPSTWARCHAEDDLRQGPIYTPSVDNLIGVNDDETTCFGKVKIVEAQRELDLASCSNNPFALLGACRFSESFEGDEVYAVRLRIGDLAGEPSVSLAVDTGLAHSDHFLTVFALSETPGDFDVSSSCRSSGAVFGSAIAMTTDSSLEKYGYCVVPDINKVYYLNVRNIDYRSPVLNNAVVKASSCGAKTLQGQFLHRCDTRIQISALKNDFGFDRVSVLQDSFVVTEGQPVHIPVVLNGGLDGDAIADFEVLPMSADKSDYSVRNNPHQEMEESIIGFLSWGYNDDNNRTQYITIVAEPDGIVEDVETFWVRITPTGVYLDDGTGQWGSQMGSGDYIVQVSIAANDT